MIEDVLVIVFLNHSSFVRWVRYANRLWRRLSTYGLMSLTSLKDIFPRYLKNTRLKG
ncbi:hypothetical protein Hdeb2414_s0008g00295631 [Helianthus debilis subsp. tardiflorus]